MKSTGEVMGIDSSLGLAVAKSQQAAGQNLPLSGQAFISVRHGDKDAVVQVAREVSQLGFKILATRGTANRLKEEGIECEQVNKISQGRPHILDKLHVSLAGTASSPNECRAFSERGRRESPGGQIMSSAEASLPSGRSFRESMKKHECIFLEHAYHEADGDVGQMARRIGLSRSAAYNKLREHGIILSERR